MYVSQTWPQLFEMGLAYSGRAVNLGRRKQSTKGLEVMSNYVTQWRKGGVLGNPNRYLFILKLEGEIKGKSTN